MGKSDVVGVQLSAPAYVAHVTHEPEKLPRLAQSPPDVSVCICGTLDHPTVSGAKQSAVVVLCPHVSVYIVSTARLLADLFLDIQIWKSAAATSQLYTIFLL